MKLKVLRETVVIKKEKFRYRSFPTILRLFSGDIITVFRDACFDTETICQDPGEHGIAGDIYYSRSKDNGLTWSDSEPVYDHRNFNENEQHGILSRVDKTIFLVSRLYGDRYDVFIASITEKEEVLSPRRLIEKPSCFRFFTVYGKILKDCAGNLIMPVYGIPETEKEGAKKLSSALMKSADNGKSWYFLSFIAHSKDISFNETSIVKVTGGKLLAVIRSENSNETLYKSVSCDNGKTWSVPETVGVRGDAPEILRLKDGRLLLAHRGVSAKRGYGFCISSSKDEGESFSGTFFVKRYKGSKYDGGYGDLLQLDDNTILSVYYVCDEDRFPWVESSLIGIC